MQLVILPHALRMVIPGLVNPAIGFLLATSLFAVIGIIDNLNAAKAAASDPNWLGFYKKAFSTVAPISFAINYGGSRYSLWLENRLGRAGQHCVQRAAISYPVAGASTPDLLAWASSVASFGQFHRPLGMARRVSGLAACSKRSEQQTALIAASKQSVQGTKITMIKIQEPRRFLGWIESQIGATCDQSLEALADFKPRQMHTHADPRADVEGQMIGQTRSSQIDHMRTSIVIGIPICRRVNEANRIILLDCRVTERHVAIGNPIAKLNRP